MDCHVCSAIQAPCSATFPSFEASSRASGLLLSLRLASGVFGDSYLVVRHGGAFSVLCRGAGHLYWARGIIQVKAEHIIPTDVYMGDMGAILVATSSFVGCKGVASMIKEVFGLVEIGRRDTQKGEEEAASKRRERETQKEGGRTMAAMTPDTSFGVCRLWYR